MHPILQMMEARSEAASLLSGGSVWCLDGRVGDTADWAGGQMGTWGNLTGLPSAHEYLNISTTLTIHNTSEIKEMTLDCSF